MCECFCCACMTVGHDWPCATGSRLLVTSYVLMFCFCFMLVSRPVCKGLLRVLPGSCGWLQQGLARRVAVSWHQPLQVCSCEHSAWMGGDRSRDKVAVTLLFCPQSRSAVQSTCPAGSWGVALHELCRGRSGCRGASERRVCHTAVPVVCVLQRGGRPCNEEVQCR